MSYSAGPSTLGIIESGLKSHRLGVFYAPAAGSLAQSFWINLDAAGYGQFGNAPPADNINRLAACLKAASFPLGQ